MNAPDPSPDDRPSVTTSLAKAGISLLLAIGIVAFLFWFSGRQRSAPKAMPPALTNGEKQAFFHDKIDPILARNKAANEEALQTFKKNLHAQFDVYREKVPAFVGDITGWGNKFKIMWESAKQVGSDDKKKVERHVTEKFNADVVSADEIRTSLENQVRALRQDIEANRNEMLAAISAAVSSDPRLAIGEVEVSKAFLLAMDANIKEVATNAGKDGAIMGGMTFLASVAAEETVRMLVTAIYVRVASSIGTSMAATATTAGGATVASAAGGGGAGALAGPPGVMVGVGVGLIFGGVVDWIMTGRLEKELNKQCTEFLSNTEQSITTDATGLVSQLQQALEEINKSTRPILRKQLGIEP